MDECRIYLDNSGEVYAVVSPEDYEWAKQWRWAYTWDRHKRKRYATRSTRRRKETAKQVKVYLHKAILERTELIPLSDAHTIGDHGDGDSLNCRRDNLSWATPAMNRATARRAA